MNSCSNLPSGCKTIESFIFSLQSLFFSSRHKFQLPRRRSWCLWIFFILDKIQNTVKTFDLPAFWTQAYREGMCLNGTQVPCEVPSPPNHTTRKGWPHHRGLRPVLFSKSDVGSFTPHKNKSVKVLWDGTYGFSSLSEKTRKSKHLQMSLQRQHFGLQFGRKIRRPPECVVRPGFEPATSRSADRSTPKWANQALLRPCTHHTG